MAVAEPGLRAGTVLTSSETIPVLASKDFIDLCATVQVEKVLYIENDVSKRNTQPEVFVFSNKNSSGTIFADNECSLLEHALSSSIATLSM